ncbi:UNVERIFIED_CONTAM: U3 snoRNP protein [Siphonaria sp. JEL0065]|nr:U3 snoRNP protein [Siphonaria sp. JEL0065]
MQMRTLKGAAISDLLVDLYTQIIREATQASRHISPTHNLSVCVANHYKSISKLSLHDELGCQGAVISLSVGDSATFVYKNSWKKKALLKRIVLESGDVLVFGGTARSIVHGVESIHPDTRPKELKEAIFNSVAYLFKYLSSEISENILPTFQIFQIVMEDHRPYIRQFGAEAFGFIIRKVSSENLNGLFRQCIYYAHQNPHRYRTPHTPETSEELWEYLYESIQSTLSTLNQEPTKENLEITRKVLEIFSTTVLLRKGARIVDRKKVFEVVNSCLVGIQATIGVRNEQQEAIVLPLVRCLAMLTAFSNLEDILNPIYIFSFCEMLQRLRSDHLAMIVMPYLINFLPTAWKSHSTMSILYLSDMMDARFETKLQFISHHLKTGTGWDKEIHDLVSGDLSKPSKLASMCVAITSTQLISLPFSEYFSRVETLFLSILKSGKSVSGKSEGEYGSISRSASVATIASRALASLITLVPRKYKNSDGVLGLVADFIETILEDDEESGVKNSSLIKLSKEQYEGLEKMLADNVGSVDPAVRLTTLRVIVGLSKLVPGQDVQFYLPVLIKTKKQGHMQLDFELHFPELPLATQVDKKADTTCTNINRIENLSRKVAAKFHHLPELDDLQYYVLLLKLLRSLPNLVEQKSEQVLPLYFELLKTDVESDESEQDEIEDENQPSKPSATISTTPPTTEMEVSSIRSVVVEFLHVFENLRNPRNVNDPERLYASFLELLTNGDAKLQQSAINCVLTWKEPGVTAYAEHLQVLADDAKFRDFLSTLDVESLRINVKTEHQPALMQTWTSTKVGLKARRNAIFAFTVALEDSDREFLIDLMVTPFKFMLKHDSFKAEGFFTFKKSLATIGSMGPIKYQQAAELELIDKPEDESIIDVVRVKQLKDVRQMCILRFAQLFNSIDNFDFGPYVPAIYESILDNRISKFDSEHTQASSSLMDLLVAWSRKPKYTDYFTQRSELVPKILGVLAAKNVKESVTAIVVGMLESFLALDKEAGDNAIAMKLIKPNMTFLLRNFEALLSKLLLSANLRLNTVNLTSRVIGVLAQTSQFVNSPVEAEKLMIILTPCLRKRSQAVPEKLKAIGRRPTLEKELIRVVVAVLENFKFKIVPNAVVVPEVEEPAPATGEDASTTGEEDVEMGITAEEDGNTMEVDSDGEDDEMEVDVPAVEKENLEQMARIHTTVVKKLIPDLFAHLTKDDEENVNLRVPVAVAITKLLTKLPVESKNMQLPKLLTTVCQFLKNRLQDVRDGSRDALLKIAKELGPVHFPFIIKELQSALLRGYQLHVLGFTVHHLLVGVTDTFRENGFESSVDMLAQIFVNDIFGTLSDEREVQEMNGKLKEMKRSKSYDSFELVAKVVKRHKITSLLNPLKELMLESNSQKTSMKIQDILRRIVFGLSVNASLNEAGMLVFIYGLITESLPLSKLEAYSKNKKSAQVKRAMVQMHRNEPLENLMSYFKANAYMFIDFGFLSS